MFTFPKDSFDLVRMRIYLVFHLKKNLSKIKEIKRYVSYA